MGCKYDNLADGSMFAAVASLMEQYAVIMIIVGIGILGMAWMPALTDRLRLSYAVIYVVFGCLLYMFLDFLPKPDLKKNNELALHLTELVVIISLMGTGLKIDQKFSFRTWHVPFRLVSINMVLCIGAMMAVCVYFLNFSPILALLIAAALSPTDPVLATDVQVGAPHEDARDNVRFSLTAEAGFNDGIAFPFIWLAIVWAGIDAGLGGSFAEWAWQHVLYQFAIAVLCGILLGKLVAFLIFGLPGKADNLVTRDGFVSIATTLLVYGVTELVHGYGFVAVFIAGLAIRDYERNHKFHKRLHEFSDQMERILVGVMLILFGGSLVNGILDHLTWKMAIAGLVFLFIIRPLSTYVSLLSSGLHKKEKIIISFFGIRGVGSVYYLLFAYSVGNFGRQDELWSLVAFIILVSIIIHGSTASILIRRLEEQLPEDNDIIA
jgi:sodium/hydrogen antiporter